LWKNLYRSVRTKIMFQKAESFLKMKIQEDLLIFGKNEIPKREEGGREKRRNAIVDEAAKRRKSHKK